MLKTKLAATLSEAPLLKKKTLFRNIKSYKFEVWLKK